MSGHGDFAAKLAGFQLQEDDRCLCGEKEFSKHLLLECSLYEDERMPLRQKCTVMGFGWPPNLDRLPTDMALWQCFKDTCKSICAKKKSLRAQNTNTRLI